MKKRYQNVQKRVFFKNSKFGTSFQKNLPPDPAISNSPCRARAKTLNGKSSTLNANKTVKNAFFLFFKNSIPKRSYPNFTIPIKTEFAKEQKTVFTSLPAEPNIILTDTRPYTTFLEDDQNSVTDGHLHSYICIDRR